MARIDLKSKPENPAIAIGLKLKAMGYSVIVCRNSKDTPGKAWETRPDDEATIRKWSGKTPAIRMQGSPNIAIVDVDVALDDVCETILDRYRAEVPEFFSRCVMRHSGIAKIALIGRSITAKKNLRSGVWGVSEEHPKGHRVEVFTVNDARYVCVAGPHSPGREYAYDGAQLWDVKVEDLPWLDDGVLGRLCDIADEEMEKAGLKLAEKKKEGDGTTAYDLKADMVWRDHEGREQTLEAWEGELPIGGDWVRGYANIWDKASETPTRVKAKVIASTGLILWDSKTDIIHRWKHLGPQMELLAPLLKALKEKVPSTDKTMFDKQLPEGVQLGDFRAHMPTHTYIFMPTGDMWPGMSLDARLPFVPLFDREGKPVLEETKKKKKPKEGEEEEPAKQKKMAPSRWLDKNRPVEQMAWAPGLGQVIEGRLLTEGGWIERRGVAAFNTYRPPIIRPGGDARRAMRWVELIARIYPDDVEHIIGFFAHRIQRPAEKINHGLVLVGAPGIGKDSLIEPLKYGVGPWNFREISPSDIMEKFNEYMCAVVIRISEARDLGDSNRTTLYERMKTMLAAPPDTLRINPKFVKPFAALNVAAAIITTNHRFDSLYLPDNDRRHYVCGTEVASTDIGGEEFWLSLWAWYQAGGIEDVVAYLAGYDLASFNAKAAPRKTPAFYQIVGHQTAPEVSELGDVIVKLGEPLAVASTRLQAEAGRDLADWLKDRKNRRTIPHRMESCGYVPVRNPDTNDGFWVIGGKRQTVYGRLDTAPGERITAARELAAAPAPTVEESLRKMQGKAGGG